MAVDAAAAAALLWAVLAVVDPDTRYLMVVHGAMTMSSWSMPTMLAPLEERTPTTRNDTFWMRISLPMGDSPRKSSRRMVWPIRQTLLLLRTSRSVKALPSVRFVHSRTSRNSGVVP